MWSWMEAAPAHFPAGVLGLDYWFWFWLGVPAPAGLELGRLREGDGVRLVHGEASVDVGFLFALLVIWGGFQSERVAGVRVRSQIHPLQFPLGQFLNDSGSVSIAEDIDHGAESVAETYGWALDGNNHSVAEKTPETDLQQPIHSHYESYVARRQSNSR